jgi:hypothetical protein
VGVEKDTTMRERTAVPIRRSNLCNRQDGSDDLLVHQEIARDFRAGDLDLDCLAEAIRGLLRRENDAPPEVCKARNSDLLSRRRRVSHVVGGKT